MPIPTFDLAVIGAGPGGYVAALHGVRLGMKVICIEKEKNLGGTCLNVGCIPSKALLESSERYYQIQNKIAEHGIKIAEASLDVSQMMARKDKIVKQLNQGIAGLFKKYKVEHWIGHAKLQGESNVLVQKEKSQETLHAKHIILATGSQAKSLPNINIDQKTILDSTGALALNKIPKKLVVLGAGAIGLEMASIYARLGSEVIILEAMDHILPGMDFEIASELQKILAIQGIKFQLSTRVTSVQLQNSTFVEVNFQNENKQESHLNTEALLVAVGRKPNTEGLDLESVCVATDDKGFIKVDRNYKTTCPGVYAIGDVIGDPMLAHKASAEAIAVVEILAGQAGQVNYQAIPNVLYTWPEAASVGLSEEEVQAKQIPYQKAKFSFRANGRALAMGDTEGWVKLIAHAKTDRLLGAHILGPQASHLIGELTLALEFSASTEDLARTIHAHPTLSEVLQEAAWNLQF